MAKEELGPHGFINRKLSLAELMHLRGLLTELLRRVRNADDPTFSSFTQHSAHPMESFDGWLAEVSDFELLLDPLAVSRCKFVSALKENPVVDGIQTHMDVVSIADPFAESLSSSLVRSYRLQETGTADDGTSYARYKLESDHSEAQRIEVISGIGSWLSWVEMQVSLLETPKPEVAKGRKQSGGRKRRQKNERYKDPRCIAAIETWHKFSIGKTIDGWPFDVVVTAPISHDKLAEFAGIAKGKATTEFWDAWFPDGGNNRYKKLCKPEFRFELAKAISKLSEPGLIAFQKFTEDVLAQQVVANQELKASETKADD